MSFSPESKMKSADRILMLEPIDGQKPLSSLGITDPDLFKNDENANRLHAIMNPETCLWTFKYEKGAVPPALKGSFTGFRAIKKFAEEYYGRRNIKITEVKD